VPGRRPDLELGVASRSDLQQIVVAAVVQLETRDDLRVAAVEALGQPQNRGKRAHCPTRAASQIAKALVRALRRRLPVVARDQRNRLDLVRLEPAQMAILDQIVRVLVVALVADMDADVVQDRRVLEPFPLAVGEAVDGARLIEEGGREARHLVGVLGPEVAALGELEDAPAPHIWIAIRLRDLLAMARDVVEDEPFAQ